MLDTDPLAVERMLRAGHVTGHEHARRIGLQPLVGEDPVAHGEPGSLGQVDPRARTHADNDEVAVDRVAVAGPHALDGARAFERVDAGPEPQFRAVVEVDVAVDAPHLAA
jgi:hypothetical protein